MTVLAFGSVRGAPGATTAALVVTSWIPDAVLVEADPAGGVLAIRFGLGREPGLLTLAAARSGVSDLREHSQQLPGGTQVVVGPETATHARHLWQIGGRAILDSLHAPGVVSVVDVGRLGMGSASEAIVDAADLVCVVCRPEAEELIPASSVLTGLPNAGVLLVGNGTYSDGDVETQLDVAVFGRLAEDHRAAAALRNGGGRGLARSSLMRSGRTIAEKLMATPQRQEVTG